MPPGTPFVLDISMYNVLQRSQIDLNVLRIWRGPYSAIGIIALADMPRIVSRDTRSSRVAREFNDALYRLS